MADNKPKNTSEEEVLTINIQPFLMPLALILSSIIIALGTFFGLKDIADSINGGDIEVADSNDSDFGNNDSDNGDGGTVTSGVTDMDDDPKLGDDDAKVAIVEFSDYECPFCKRFFEETYGEIKSEYIDSGKIQYVFRDYPLSFHEPFASQAASAGECVQEIAGDEKYFEFHDGYMSQTKSNVQGLLSSETLAELDDLANSGDGDAYNDFLNNEGVRENKEGILDIVRDIDVDVDEVSDCMDEDKFGEEIENDIAEGTAAGVTGTPGFIIGVIGDDGEVSGEVVSGAQSFATFKAAIERQLANAE